MTTTTTSATSGPWHDAGDGFFGPMSPDSWPDGDNDFQTVLSSLAGSDRAYSKSPNSSLNSGYSPPPQQLTGLPLPITPLVQAQPYGIVSNVHLQTSFQPISPDVPDSASNSPASVPVHTPPEMNASIDQMLEMNPALWSQSSPSIDQSWEMVPRQSSITSLDSPTAPSHGSYDRVTDLFPMMPGEPQMSVQQQHDAAFVAQPFQYPIQHGSSILSMSPCPRVDHCAAAPPDFSPSPTARTGMHTMANAQPAADLARFPPASQFDLDMAKPFSHMQRQPQQPQQQPWSSESLRNMMNMEAAPDALVFGPGYYLAGHPPQMQPVTEEQLRRSLSASTSHSLSPETSPTALPATSLDMSVAFSTGQEVSFPIQGSAAHGYVSNDMISQQPLFVDTSPLQAFSTADQYPFPNYVADASLISPTAESHPRSSISSVNLSMEHMAEALVPANQGSGFVNPFGGESPPMISSAQHVPQASESPTATGSVDLSLQSSAAQRSGGRQLGSHLDPDKRKDANTMREVGACWSCALQRDKCGPGDPCHRCEKRKHKANGPHPQLACDRTPLWDLLEFFLPSQLTDLHKPKTLEDFVGKHTTGWTNMRIKLKLIPGRGLPAMVCEAYEFIPQTNESARQFQYFKDHKTGLSQRREKPSPPLGMMQIEQEDIKRYSKYLDEIVEHHFRAFAQMYCSDDEYDFQLRLLEFIRDLKPESKDEKLLLHEVRRLIVVTYIMGHTLVLEEANRAQVLPRLRFDRRSASDYGSFCSPRVVNRQLKYLFCGLHKTTMHEVYKRLQQMLKKSTQWPPAKWTAAFCAMLGLAMVHEDTQKTIQLVMDHKTVSEGMDERHAREGARRACEAIDVKFSFVMALFMRRSSKSENPIVHRDGAYWAGKLERNCAMFAENVRKLVSNNYVYLHQQKQIPSDSQGNFTSRLVGRFITALYDQS
ncbi:fungal zn binuclear cluster domain containing protein [Diplodia corticola]|uniref:Fungal zn binuclear cluster domain containing protein n=1 Tax=Diplodia corticola TaxID=236234 RepID=A0A1J9RZ49_9PEZI|nr:fungal zn binuclear cluster domain containing protein [Diplodia corticola]OJD32725.1 fungal zn binuclear cluster domain containing protein [Diplodia corticola]